MKTLFSLLAGVVFIVCFALSPLHAQKEDSDDWIYEDRLKLTEWEMRGVVRALFDREPYVVSYALSALRFQRPAYRNRFITPEVARHLANRLNAFSKNLEGEFVVEILTELGRQGKPYLPSLIAELQNRETEWSTRWWIAGNLSRIDVDRSLLPSFRATLLNRDAPVESRFAAACAAWKMGGLKPKDAPILFSFVERNRSPLDRQVLSSIGSLGKLAAPPLSKLLRLLRSERGKHLGWEILNLIAIRDDAASRDFLLGVINNSKADLEARERAVYALYNIKDYQAFDAALSALVQNPKTPLSLRSAIATLFGERRDESKLPFLVTMLRDKTPVPSPFDRDIRDSVVSAISKMGKRAAPYIPEMMRYLRQRDAFEQHNSFEAISKIPGGKGDFSRALTDILRDSNTEDGQFCDVVEFLTKLEGRNISTLPQIIRRLKTREADVKGRAWIATELRHTGDALKPFIPDLLALILDKETDSSIAASLVVTLRGLGHSLSAVLSELTGIANDAKQSAAARGRATSIIGKIRPLTLEESLVHINLTYGKLQEPARRRFEAYTYSGGDVVVVRLLKRLAPLKPLPKTLARKERAEELRLYRSVLPKTEGLTDLRADLTRQIVALEAMR